MTKGIFITATGTEIGKTYVTALLTKKLKQAGMNAGYYKAALSGADTIANSDAGYLKRFSGISQDENTMLSYLYTNAVSPHLASQIEGNPLSMQKVIADFTYVKDHYEYITVEGSGGIVCPIRYDEVEQIFLTDIIKSLGLHVLIVADAGLGTINAVTLTAEYLKSEDIGIKGVILNNYTGGIMQNDNIKMIEAINKIPVIAVVKPDAVNLELDISTLTSLYEEVR